MKEQLTQYVELLFAGAPNAYEIKQEILQNTLDRYDDLLDQGKSPEAAYRLAISGIGDINEILGADAPSPAGLMPRVPRDDTKNPQAQKMRAVAVAMYILSAIPLFLFSEFGLDTLGLCLTLLLVATATALIIMVRKQDKSPEPQEEVTDQSPQQELRKCIDDVISISGLVIYFVVSFATGAWFSTWLIFPIVGCLNGLVKAILDLKEANANET